LLQFRQDIAEHGVEYRRLDRVELAPDLAVAGDFPHTEQGLAVRTPLAGLQMPLMGQDGWALHKERGERGEHEIGHGVGRVLASPQIRHSLTAAAERIEEAIQQ